MKSACEGLQQVLVLIGRRIASKTVVSKLMVPAVHVEDYFDFAAL
jgi:hypothetical protein